MKAMSARLMFNYCICTLPNMALPDYSPPEYLIICKQPQSCKQSIQSKPLMLAPLSGFGKPVIIIRDHSDTAVSALKHADTEGTRKYSRSPDAVSTLETNHYMLKYAICANDQQAEEFLAPENGSCLIQ